MTDQERRQRILSAQPPIPGRKPPDPADRLDADLNPQDYGEHAPDPPAHRYPGPWAVYQVFDPDRDREEDLRDAALSARWVLGSHMTRARMLEAGRDALDLTRAFKDQHEGFSEWEVGRELVLPGLWKRESLEVRVARVREKRLAHGIPKAGPTPPTILNDLGEWAVRRAFDPDRHAPEDHDVVVACMSSSPCTTGDPDALRLVDSAARALLASADLRASGEPFTEEAFRDRWMFGLDAKRRARRRKDFEDSLARAEAVQLAAELIGWHRPKGVRIQQHSMAGSYMAVAEHRGVREHLKDPTLHENPPAHIYRGRWAVHTIATAEGFSRRDEKVAAAALEGLAFFNRGWREKALNLARKVLQQAKAHRASGESLKPYDVALAAVLGRWPTLLAWVREGNDPDRYAYGRRPPRKRAA